MNGKSMPAVEDKEASENHASKRTPNERSKREAVEEVRIDRLDVDWNEGGIPDFVGRLPLHIS